MKKKKVIDRKNLPFRLPLFDTIGVLTALSYWKAPEWLWGVVCVLLFFLWVGVISHKWNSESVDIIEKIEK